MARDHIRLIVDNTKPNVVPLPTLHILRAMAAAHFSNAETDRLEPIAFAPRPRRLPGDLGGDDLPICAEIDGDMA